MYKLSGKVINFIQKPMVNWTVEDRRGNQKNLPGRFTFTTAIFVIAMIPLNYMFRKCTGATNLQNHKKDYVV